MIQAVTAMSHGRTSEHTHTQRVVHFTDTFSTFLIVNMPITLALWYPNHGHVPLVGCKGIAEISKQSSS